VSTKTTSAMVFLSSMICTINNTSGLSMPSVGSSVSMVSEMNAMLTAAGVSGVTINTADLALATNAVGTSDYTYSLNATLGSPIVPTTTDLQIDMLHRPLDSANLTYTGKFSYYFNNSDPVGNCNSQFGALNTSDITELGSVVYETTSTTDLSYDAKYTQACGHGNSTPLSSGVLDPTIKADATIPDINGWSGNFTRLISDFDPSASIGNFAFMWQAGAADGTARTFDLRLHDDDGDGRLNGIAFFGFGADIATAVGDILGMYCNYAGPNGYVDTGLAMTTPIQRQAIVAGATEFSVDSSNIAYAPTNNCDASTVDIAAGFEFDVDADGTPDVPVPDPYLNDLIDPTDATLGIAASGFTLPAPPAGP
jgi:hypothetical protein